MVETIPARTNTTHSKRTSSSGNIACCLGHTAGRGKPATLSELGTVSVPILLMNGDADLYTPPAALRIFKQHMPRAQMIIVPDTGHAAQWANPEFFSVSVLKFLGWH